MSQDDAGGIPEVAWALLAFVADTPGGSPVNFGALPMEHRNRDVLAVCAGRGWIRCVHRVNASIAFSSGAQIARFVWQLCGLGEADDRLHIEATDAGRVRLAERRLQPASGPPATTRRVSTQARNRGINESLARDRERATEQHARTEREARMAQLAQPLAPEAAVEQLRALGRLSAGERGSFGYEAAGMIVLKMVRLGEFAAAPKAREYVLAQASNPKGPDLRAIWTDFAVTLREERGLPRGAVHDTFAEDAKLTARLIEGEPATASRGTDVPAGDHDGAPEVSNMDGIVIKVLRAGRDRFTAISERLTQQAEGMNLESGGPFDPGVQSWFDAQTATAFAKLCEDAATIEEAHARGNQVATELTLNSLNTYLRAQRYGCTDPELADCVRGLGFAAVVTVLNSGAAALVAAELDPTPLIRERDHASDESRAEIEAAVLRLRGVDAGEPPGATSKRVRLVPNRPPTNPTRAVSLAHAATRWFGYERRKLQDAIAGGTLAASQVSPKLWHFDRAEVVKLNPKAAADIDMKVKRRSRKLPRR